jgi:hypothetical protein
MIVIGSKNVGRVAERIVANELEARGFRVSDLNSDGTAPNADLLAVSSSQMLQIQVKGAANSVKERWWVEYGYCTAEIISDRTTPMFNRSKSFYKARFIILVAVKAPRDYCCVVLPIETADEAVQLNLERDYRTLTRAGQIKKPHKVWVSLDPAPRARRVDALLDRERAILSAYRDEQGWERLLQSN